MIGPPPSGAAPIPLPRPPTPGRRLGAAAAAWLVFAAIPVAIHRGRIDTPRTLMTGTETGSIYLEAARNDLRLGVLETSFVPMTAAGERRPEDRTWYPNHPPLLVHGVAAVASTGLDVLTASRVFMILSWSAAATAVFLLARRRGASLPAWIAGLTVTLASGTLRGGLFVEVVTGPVVPLSLWAVVAYLAYRDRPTRTRAALVFAACILAGFSDWPGLLAPGFILLDRVLVDRRWRDPMALLAFVPFAIVGAWRAVTLRATAGARAPAAAGDSAPGFLDILAGRINEGPVLLDGSGGPGLKDVMASASEFSVGGVAGAVALVGALVLAREAVRGTDPSAARRGLLLAFFAPAAYLALFFRGAVIHPFWTLSAVPGLALFVSEGLVAGASLLGTRLGPRGVRAALLLLGGGVLAIETRAGLAAISEQDATTRAADDRLLEVAAAAGQHLGPADRLAVVGDEIRADHLGWHLDCAAVALHPSPEGLAAFRAAFHDRMCVLVPASFAVRLPALAAALSEHPFVRLSVDGEPLLLFDLGPGARFRDRLSAEQRAALRARAESLPVPEPVVAPDSVAGVVRIDPAGPGAGLLVRVGLDPFHSLPLCALRGGSGIPLERFPPGVAFVSVSRPEGEVIRVSAPARVERGIDAAYRRRAALTASSIGGGMVALYLLAARRGRDRDRRAAAPPIS